MKNKNEESIENQIQKSLSRLIELSEKNMIIELYLAGAKRDEIKAVVGIGTEKVDQVISKIKDLRKDTKNV